VFIFGRYGFPEWGMAGAAAGTIVSIAVEMAIYAIIFFGRPCREVYGSLREWRFEWDLFRRLLRYGAPTGVQISLNVLSFALFMFMVGQLGKAEKAATALAFRVETFAFLPMLGTSFAVTALVGRRLAQERVDLAEKTTWSGGHVAAIYMTAVAALFVFAPDLFIALYGMEGAGGGDEGAIARVLLRFVAVFSVFNSANLVFNAALRGAGDTRFVAVLSLVLSWTVMLVPAALAIFVVGNLYLAWAFVTLYAVSLAVSFFWRYRTGQWKRMRVIEDEAPPGVE
jgi:MATE family multidrug resistance protein